MPNPENLKGHEFQPGQSGNPAGKPKGTKSLSTVLKEMLEVEVEVKHEDGTKEKKPLRDVLMRKLIKKANDGDLRAIQTILDRVDGKAAQFIEMQIPGGLETLNKHVVEFRDFSKPKTKKKATKPPEA